jgi:threonine dehydrogenase-like Zn-dependent dehydrogenase
MQSLVYRGAWQAAIEEKPDPQAPVRDEVLVRIRATGICGTDIGIVLGDYTANTGVTLGHESSGTVEAVGPEVRTVKPGDRVVIDPTFFCGMCHMCRTGRQNHCAQKSSTETGVSRDGTFAPYYTTAERFVYPLAAGISFEAGTLTEPLSCALTGVSQLRTRPDLRTLVLGGGPMGIVYTHALQTQGISGAVVEISRERLTLAERAVPAGWRGEASITEAVEAVSSDGQVDLVVDTTGVLSDVAIKLLARGGQFLAVGLRTFVAGIDMRRVADESLSIQGSIDSLGTFASAIHLINTDAIKAQSLVTHSLDLADFRDGFALLGCDIAKKSQRNEARAIKTVLRPH